MKVFLSGAVENVEDQAFPRSWRLHARFVLEEFGHTVVDPTAYPQVERTVNEIVHRNMFLQRSCDVVLAEYTIPNRAYCGTDFELVKASEWGQPVVLWADESYRERVYLKYIATTIVPTLDAAIDYIVSELEN